MERSGFVLSAMLLLAVMVFAAPVQAGDLNPPGAPAPTMKTLDQVAPIWSVKLPCDSKSNCPRFVVLADFSNQAVLDKETGLVWEISPDTTAQAWGVATQTCMNKAVGNRRGWRLPTSEELGSLVDPTVSNTSLPIGHPFTNVKFSNVQGVGGVYWSATTYASDTIAAWTLQFGNGLFFPYVKTSDINYAWCVRAGRGPDAQ